MSFINFESGRVKEQLRNEKRRAQEAILEKAEEDYKRRKERELRAAERGDDKWMLPSLEAQLQPDSKKKKKHKKEKKSKKEKKHKHKKKTASSNGSSDGSSDEQWVENQPGPSKEGPKKESTEEGAPERDEWMTLPALFPCVTRDQVRAQKRHEPTPQEQEALKKKFLLDNPGQSERELNPYWKDGGQGLPEQDDPDPESLSLPAGSAGDHGLAWLRRALRRVEEQAKEEGRSEEDVAAQRWGSLAKLKTMLAEAEQRCRTSRRRGRGRDGRGRGGRVQGPKSQPREYEDWREDPSAGESAVQSEEVGNKSRYRAWLGIKEPAVPEKPPSEEEDSASEDTDDEMVKELKRQFLENEKKEEEEKRQKELESFKRDTKKEEDEESEEEEEDTSGKIMFRARNKNREKDLKEKALQRLAAFGRRPPVRSIAERDEDSDEDDKAIQSWKEERRRKGSVDDSDEEEKSGSEKEERDTKIKSTGKKNDIREEGKNSTALARGSEGARKEDGERGERKYERNERKLGGGGIREEEKRREHERYRERQNYGNERRRDDDMYRERRKEGEERKRDNERGERSKDDKEERRRVYEKEERRRESDKERRKDVERDRRKDADRFSKKEREGSIDVDEVKDKEMRRERERDRIDERGDLFRRKGRERSTDVEEEKGWRRDKEERRKQSDQHSDRRRDERERFRERDSNSPCSEEGRRRTEIPEYIRKSRSSEPYQKLPPRKLPTFRKPEDDDVGRRAHPDILGDERRGQSSSSSRNWRKREFQKPMDVEKSPASRALEKPPARAPARPPSPEPEEEEKQPEPEPTLALSDTEMNALAAKLMKAEILGNQALVSRLKDQMEKARIAREQRKTAMLAPPSASSKQKPQEEDVILTRRDAKGFVRPLTAPEHPEPSGGRRRAQKVATHSKDGLRERYFPDDDKYTLENMFQREKMTTVEDANEEFVRLAGKEAGKTESEYDLDDLFEEKAMREKPKGKLERLERDRAIREYKRVERSLDSCLRCFDSPRMLKHLLIALGSKVYLSLPGHQSLTDGHCLLSPVHHVPCATQLDEDVWEEMTTFRKALVAMLAKQDLDCVFFESAMHLNRFPHMTLECIPLPREVGDTAPIYFKKAILESEMEWSMNKKLVDLKGKGVRRGVPKGLPYFSVDFGLEDGFAHVIEDEKLFPENFAQEIIGGMLDLDHSIWRKQRKENFDIQRKKVLQFEEWWKPFDFTKNTSADDSSTSSDSD